MLNAIEFLCIGLWLGADVFLSFIVAPGAFSVLASRDAAGAIVGYSLTRMHVGGILCGIIFLTIRLLRSFLAAVPNARVVSFASPVVACVALMIAVTTISQFTASARMAALRVQMGSIGSTAPGSSLLAEFGRLHRISVSLEAVVLLSGLAAIYFLTRQSA